LVQVQLYVRVVPSQSFPAVSLSPPQRSGQVLVSDKHHWFLVDNGIWVGSKVKFCAAAKPANREVNSRVVRASMAAIGDF